MEHSAVDGKCRCWSFFWFSKSLFTCLFVFWLVLKCDGCILCVSINLRKVSKNVSVNQAMWVTILLFLYFRHSESGEGVYRPGRGNAHSCIIHASMIGSEVDSRDLSSNSPDAVVLCMNKTWGILGFIEQGALLCGLPPKTGSRVKEEQWFWYLTWDLWNSLRSSVPACSSLFLPHPKMILK